MNRKEIDKLPTPELDALSQHERHNNYAETRHWCNQYYLKARSLERKLAAAIDLLEGMCPHMDRPWQETIDELLAALKEDSHEQG